MRAAALLCIALLAGCNREPDFSERYDAASKQIGTTAKQIDDEIDKRAKAASPRVIESSPAVDTGPQSGDGP
ncbi:MAG: hypothetical protein KDE32_15185 [Novosphingobium sp.]|nr:hypothetical protein [Novosphingobium sp.]